MTERQQDDDQAQPAGEITCDGYGPVPTEPMADIEGEEDSSAQERTQ
jgi:hypothetical protein